ncbi:MAG: hypothetical protein RLZZ528_959, partial [Pseudomonadota bacterium]
AIVAALGQGRIVIDEAQATVHEAKLLRLDCTKARIGLGWVPKLGFEDCVRLTADWYGAWANGADPQTLTLSQIGTYEDLVS